MHDLKTIQHLNEKACEPGILETEQFEIGQLAQIKKDHAADPAPIPCNPNPNHNKEE